MPAQKPKKILMEKIFWYQFPALHDIKDKYLLPKHRHIFGAMDIPWGRMHYLGKVILKKILVNSSFKENATIETK